MLTFTVFLLGQSQRQQQRQQIDVVTKSTGHPTTVDKMIAITAPM